MNTTTRNLFFLLAVSPMAIGGCIGTEEDDDDIAYSTGASDGLTGVRHFTAAEALAVDAHTKCEGAYERAYYGSECADAIEQLKACLSGLSCEDFVLEPVPECEARGEQVFEICRFSGATPGSD